MSSLNASERRKLESLFGMASGYVLDFTDTTFGEFFAENADIDIHSQMYQSVGTSKAKKLREFWRLESDPLVGSILLALIERWRESADPGNTDLAERCEKIATRLLAGGPNLSRLKEVAVHLDAQHLARQVKRMEECIESDPDLAIGSAKELVETCC